LSSTRSYPSIAPAALRCREVEQTRTLGLGSATAGSADLSAWDAVIDVQTEAVVLVGEIGEIDTTWVVYGTKKRFEGDVIGIPSPELFHRAAQGVVG
jgi:hypothetical protein